MKRHLAGLIVTFVGATLMQIAASDTYLRFVRPGMRPLLLIAGAVLVIFAVIDVFAESNRSPKSATAHGDPRVGDSHGHSHEHSPKVAWLLLMPVLTLLVVNPPALGAAAVARQSPVAAKPVTDAQPRGLGGAGAAGKPVTMTIRDYSSWAVWEKESLRNQAFSLTGFVTPGKNGIWYVARIGITCCVADGTAYAVEVRGQPQPPKNQWVTVSGMWAEPTKERDGDIAAIDATSITPVRPPANPYE